jgi:hypothetical protein
VANHASRRTPTHGERFWVPDLGLNCRRWHPAKTPGVLRIASSVLHILPQTAGTSNSAAPDARGRKAAQEHFSEESFQTKTQFGNAFSKAQPEFCAVLRKTHGLQQAWINSRNQTTIATRAKHRQPMFFPGSCPVWIFRFGIELFLLPQREQFPHWSVLTSLQFAFALR